MRHMNQNPQKHIWSLTIDFDWGSRGPRRTHRYYFTKKYSIKELSNMLDIAESGLQHITWKKHKLADNTRTNPEGLVIAPPY